MIRFQIVGLLFNAGSYGQLPVYYICSVLWISRSSSYRRVPISTGGLSRTNMIIERGWWSRQETWTNVVGFE